MGTFITYDTCKDSVNINVSKFRGKFPSNHHKASALALAPARGDLKLFYPLAEFFSFRSTLM